MTQLNDAHWVNEDYIQRMEEKDWKQMLLRSRDTMTFHGKVRQLQAKKIGYGVVEVSKVPLQESAL